MKISIEIESIKELAELMDWRDTLRDRVKQLESKPLEFSLRSLAEKVIDPFPSLTPDQKEKLKARIEQGMSC